MPVSRRWQMHVDHKKQMPVNLCKLLPALTKAAILQMPVKTLTGIWKTAPAGI